MLDLAAPYPPLVYFLHTIVGSLGVLLALVALSQQKGRRGHVRAGWGFVGAAAIAATTALIFSGTQPAPLAIASALMTLGLLWGAVLALRPATRPVRRGEWGATALMTGAWLIMVLLGGFGLAVILDLASLPPGVETPPIGVVLLPLAYALFPTYFLVDDARFRRLDGQRRPGAFRRHLSRMAFALAIAIHAPIVSFADDLKLHPLLAFFGPFVIWPLLLYALRLHPLLRATGTAQEDAGRHNDL